MKYICALIWAVVFIGAAIGFWVSKTEPDLFWPMTVIGFIGGVIISQIDILKRVKAPGGWEVETARAQITEKTEEGIQRIRDEVSVQREAITSLIDKAEATRKELLIVAEMSSPPSLSLLEEKINIVKTDTGYRTVLVFKPSKSRPPLGPTGFRAKVEDTSNAKIIDFDDAGSEHVRTLSKEISNDGKKAQFTYDPGHFEYPRVILVTSDACRVHISSSHISEQYFVNVE